MSSTVVDAFAFKCNGEGCREVSTAGLTMTEAMEKAAAAGWRLAIGAARPDFCPRCISKPKD